MKLYVHLEGSHEFTKVFKSVESNSTIADVLTFFVDAYNTKHHGQHQLFVEKLTAWTSNHQPISKSVKLKQVVEDGGDLFVRTEVAQPTTAQTPSQDKGAASTSGIQPAPAQTPCPTEQPSDNSLKARKAADKHSHLLPLLEPLLKKADDYTARSNYRAALEIYQQASAIAPAHTELSTKLAKLWLKVGSASTALEWAEKALATQPGSSHLHQLVAECLMQAGRAEEAVAAYEQAINASREADEPEARERELQVGLASVLYSNRDNALSQQIAGQLVMSILEQDPDNWEALYLYATIAFDRKIYRDVVNVALRLIVSKPSHKGVHGILARCLETQEGLASISEFLQGGASLAPALAFIATSVKDKGAVPACIELFKQAIELDPSHANHVLNYAHALELEQRLGDVVSVARQFCLDCKVELPSIIDLEDVEGTLDALPPHQGVTDLVWLHHQPFEPSTTGADSSSTGQASQASKDACEQDPKIEYSSQQLDVLALLFTVVKVLYIGGALPAAQKLCKMLQLLRSAAATPLHQTLIRNEAAYFGCVSQLLEECPPPSTSSADLRAAASSPLYLCGDSHCLSGAWRLVTVRSQPRLLQPLLVTGCKIWHLRQESEFYPKVQFYNTIRALPRGAQVILLFGEIDCREGLLVAVEKCKYNDIEEAIEVDINIYLEVIFNLLEELDLEIFVHPIPPVLNETRNMVKRFAKVLRRKVHQGSVMQVVEASNSRRAQGRLHYLDFFDCLLTDDGMKLKPELEFDGTHMAPAYMKYLAAELTKVG